MDLLINPTLDDVAIRAGVSSATVSRFFNNPAVVAARTAERIRLAVEQTGYIPNMLAGGLASSKSRLVAVLIPHLTNAIFTETIEEMVTSLASANMVPMLGLTGNGQERTEALVMAALGRRADAIITTAETSPAIREILRRSRTTVIEVWDLPADPIDIAVGFSHVAVGEDLARFLKARGYRRPHLVTANGNRARVRRDALVAEWLATGGIQPTEDMVEIPSHFGQARGIFAAMRRLETMPDVVVCGSDWLAQGLIVEAQAAGLRVPDDLAIIGFGNASVTGEMRPTITTVDVDGGRIAREAISLLHRRDEGEDITARRIDVGFRIIARESA